MGKARVSGQWWKCQIGGRSQMDRLMLDFIALAGARRALVARRGHNSNMVFIGSKLGERKLLSGTVQSILVAGIGNKARREFTLKLWREGMGTRLRNKD